MKFYDALKTPIARGIGLGAGLLKVQEGMNCEHDGVPDIATLCPIAFASKTFSSIE